MDFHKYIHNEETTHIDKINLINNKNGKIVVLYELTDDNYRNVLKYIILNKFNYNNAENIYFDFGAKVVKFENLKLSDLTCRLGSNIRINKI